MKVHSTLVSEMCISLKNELTEEISSQLDTAFVQFRNEIRRNQEQLQGPYEGTRNVDKYGLKKEEIYNEPITPKYRSTPIVSKQWINEGRPVQKPTLYDGKMPWESYFVQFNVITEMNGWQEHQKAAYLASSLTGTALNVLGNLPFEKRHEFKSLVAALETRYGTAHRTDLARAGFKNRIKQKDESLHALAEDIERPARCSYPDAPVGIVDTLARDQVIDALPDEDMRLRLKQERPQSLQRAQEVALELESFQLASRQMRGRAVRTTQLARGDCSRQSKEGEEVGNKEQRDGEKKTGGRKWIPLCYG